MKNRLFIEEERGRNVTLHTSLSLPTCVIAIYYHWIWMVYMVTISQNPQNIYALFVSLVGMYKGTHAWHVADFILLLVDYFAGFCKMVCLPSPMYKLYCF